MDYPQVTIDTAADELNRLHKGIEANLQRTVQDAVRAGEILTRVKSEKGHGEFLPWLKANCSFSPDTGERYRKLYAYHSKIRSVRNLQEAYRQIETIEKQENQTERQRAMERVKEYRKTGVKPEGWRRGTDDKMVEDEERRDRRVEEAKRNMEKERERKEEERAERERKGEQWKAKEAIFEQALSTLSEETQRRASFKERIRLSDAGKDDAFVDAIMDYLEELSDDNRRIEACYNIIKVAKNIAVELQREKGE